MHNTLVEIINDNSFNRIILKRSIQLGALFLSGIIVVYFLPHFMSYIYVLLLCVLFWRSSLNYFWLAFFFILFATPAKFFAGGVATMAERLPLFSIAKGQGLSFSTHDIFMIIAIVKALNFGIKPRFFLSKPLKLLLGYGIFLIILAVIWHQVSPTFLADKIRSASRYSALFFIPALINKREDMVKFIYLLFPFVFLIFINGIYFYLTQKGLVQLVTTSVTIPKMSLSQYGADVLRYSINTGEASILFVSFLVSTSLLTLTALKVKTRIYLYIVAAASIIAGLMPASRAWFVVFSLVAIAFLLKTRNKFRNIILLFGGILVMLMIFSSNQILSGSANAAWGRISTVFQLGEEKTSSTESIQSRVQHDLPITLQGIKENPVTGWGFTDKRGGNQDVGNFALIFKVGIIGFLLFIFFWYSYIKLLRSTRKYMLKNNPLRSYLSIFLWGFIGLLLMHFTTSQIFGYYKWTYFTTIFLLVSEFFVKEARLYDLFLRKNLKSTQ